MADSIAARLRELRKRIHEENGCGLKPDCAWSLAIEALAVEVEAFAQEMRQQDVGTNRNAYGEVRGLMPLHKWADALAWPEGNT